MPYTYTDIVREYENIGIEPGDIVYVVSAMWQMTGYEEEGMEALTDAYTRALLEVIGPEGTLVVSTATLNLCNTDIPFDPVETPSFNCGQVSEHVRQMPGARRSFHPFRSYAAVGARAEDIAADVSRHAYGPETPEARMIELGAKLVNIGLPPNICSTVHHVEQVMAVPYRYTKEFMHPVVRGGEIVTEPYYLHVLYRNSDVERSHNKTLFERLKPQLPIKSVQLGRGHIYAYGLSEFYREATRIFTDDIYVWCKRPPTVRPYTE